MSLTSPSCSFIVLIIDFKEKVSSSFFFPSSPSGGVLIIVELPLQRSTSSIISPFALDATVVKLFNAEALQSRDIGLHKCLEYTLHSHLVPYQRCVELSHAFTSACQHTLTTISAQIILRKFGSSMLFIIICSTQL